jgi:hypothetical protein
MMARPADAASRGPTSDECPRPLSAGTAIALAIGALTRAELASALSLSALLLTAGMGRAPVPELVMCVATAALIAVTATAAATIAVTRSRVENHSADELACLPVLLMSPLPCHRFHPPATATYMFSYLELAHRDTATWETTGNTGVSADGRRRF